MKRNIRERVEKRAVRATISIMTAVMMLLAVGAQAYAEEEKEPSGEEDAGEEGTEKENEDPRFLTGLDFSYLASARTDLYGPGLSWGLVLIPHGLELGVSAGAMIGGHTYSVPIEARLEVPFRVAGWLDLYLSAGPTIFFDKRAGSWRHDFAASLSGGAQITPPGFHWSLRVSGDYGLRFARELLNTGGFSAGFIYRF
ncbi:MAG: hypothetical protein R6V85_18030 [Polyangia bacterium]